MYCLPFLILEVFCVYFSTVSLAFLCKSWLLHLHLYPALTASCPVQCAKLLKGNTIISLTVEMTAYVTDLICALPFLIFVCVLHLNKADYKIRNWYRPEKFYGGGGGICFT